MTDVALSPQPDTGAIDLTVVNRAIALDDTLQTAVLISLFTDRRATVDDPLPVGMTQRRGWWGDPTLGSKLWTLAQEKQTDTTRQRAQQYCEEALRWLTTNRIASSVAVTTEWHKPGWLAITVALTRPNQPDSRFSYLWEAQANRAV